MANFNFNKVILIGKLARNIDTNSAAPFSIEIPRRFKEGASDIIPIIPANDKVIDTIKQGITTAKSACIEGVIRVTSIDKNGTKISLTEIVADSVTFSTDITPFNMNQVIIAGKLVRDVETRTAGQTNVATFTVAVNRPTKDKTADYVRVTAFGKTADFVGKYFHKGSSICVRGDIRVDVAEKNGFKNVYTNVSADTVSFVDGMNDSDGNKGYTVKHHVKNQTIQTPYNSAPAEENPLATAPEEDLPF